MIFFEPSGAEASWAKAVLAQRRAAARIVIVFMVWGLL
jgi:hypothetical protein